MAAMRNRMEIDGLKTEEASAVLQVYCKKFYSKMGMFKKYCSLILLEGRKENC